MNKQEHYVHKMFDQVTEHLHQLKSLAANPASKESDVEHWCQSVLRYCLGFTAIDGYEIHAQESKGKLRPDLIILKDAKPICVVEVKKINHDLNKSDFRSGKVQLSEYLHSLGNVRWGILSNGFEWRLYDFSETTKSGIVITSFSLIDDEDEKLNLSKRSIEDNCCDLLEFHESTYASKGWEKLSKEATAFAPDSLAKAILAADTVKNISKVIRGEHDYNASTEVLFDKLHDLLTNGLTTLLKDWNEVKENELNKYMNTQKRAGRKKRRATPAKEARKEAVETGTVIAAKNIFAETPKAVEAVAASATAAVEVVELKKVG